ncbi:hypothetical protein H6B07_20190, partial [Mediterraneibacter glycyrrhizinilyticus]|nr:hypothetical protein [Mediterraneibacter glycyrrhizinilyticus]
ADNMPVITEDCTLKAAAVLEGVYSAVQTLQYTVSDSGEEGTLLHCTGSVRKVCMRM